MTEDSEKLARATATLEYEDMKEKVRKIFGDPVVQGEKGGVPDVKEEAFYGDGYNKGDRRNKSGFYSGHRGSSRSRRGRGFGNQPSSSSKVLRCFGCDSTKHFAKDCPHKEEKEEVNMNVNITLFNSKPESVQKNLLL